MLGAIALFPGSGLAQSFDCRAARTPDEMTICANSGLARLDQQLATAYRRDADALGDDQRQAFQQNEVAFINARRRCGDDRRCIAESYRNRIHELQTLMSQSDRDEPGGAAVDEDRPDQRAEPRRGPTPTPARPTVTTIERTPEAGGNAPTREPSVSVGNANETEPAEGKKVAKHREAKPRHVAKTVTAATSEAPAASAATGATTAASGSSSAPAKPTIQWANPPPAR